MNHIKPKSPRAIAVARQSSDRVTDMLRAALVATLMLGALFSATIARSAPDSFADLVDEFSPAVVNITTTTKVAQGIGPQGIFPEGSPFEDLFRDRQGAPNRPQRDASALGSGFVISKDGYIVTNNHVIEGADEIVIEFFGREKLPAKLVGTDKNVDIAVLKVETDKELPFVEFGNSDKMRVGDWVMAMGNPLGQGFSVSAGIVSARNRELQGNYDDYIQTDAAINRGNSGGPLFNMDGDVIGVNTAILSPTGGSIGIGFSMASNVVSKVVDQLIEFGEVRRGWLGVMIQPVTDDIAESQGLEKAMGALVTDAYGAPAKDAGVMAGDIILKFDGEDVEDTGDLVRRVGDASVGTEVAMTVQRGGEEKELKVVLGQRPSEAELAADRGNGSTPKLPSPEPKTILGLTLLEIDDEKRAEMDLPKDANGLIVTEVAAGSTAEEKGLLAGDIITEAGQVKIATIAEFNDQIEATKEAGRKSMLLMIRRGGAPRFVALKVDE